MRSFAKLLSARQSTYGVNPAWRLMYVQRSVDVSISPNKSLLPPLLLVAADVADAAEEVVEKDTDGLLARIDAEGPSCVQVMIRKGSH